MHCLGRLKKELQMLSTDPPHGITCWPSNDKLNQWEVRLVGAVDTPYEGGVFKLEILVPERYPFEPPKVHFLTQIYHPNIDDKGRICLDVLKMPPQGSWKPAHNLSTVLTSIQLLLAEANPDDGLMADISHEYKYNRPKFLENAKQWVKRYAKEDVITIGTKRSSQANTEDIGLMGVTICMEEDKTIQLEELESLEAIYGSDFNLLNDSTCIINIQPSVAEYGAMEIKVILPADYPSCSPPVFEIRRSELSDKEKQEIAIHVNELFNIGDVVIYQSVEWIREYITNRAKKLSETTSELSDVEELEVMHIVKEDLIDLTIQSPNSQKIDTDFTPVDVVYSPNIIHGEPLVDRKSTFQAHATEVHSSQEVKQVMSILKENRKIAMATHNILAYRFIDENKGGVLVQDCEDDGENAAGGRLLHLLQVMDVCNVLVVVSRWYGGVHLGPDRFKHINNVARTLLQTTGMGIKVVSVTSKTTKDRNKGKLKKHKS